MKTYILKPIMTPTTLTLTPTLDKPAVVRSVPPRQPLPTVVMDPGKPLLKLGLDVHLEFIMVVAQTDHANPHAPRKFPRPELVAQVRQWVAEGFQVFCGEESCGFGFVLHRELVAAGAQSFLITPIALNGQRKTDKLDAPALCLRLSRWLDGNRDELAPIRIPSEAEQRKREGTRRWKFPGRLIRMLGNHGHGECARRGVGSRTGPKANGRERRAERTTAANSTGLPREPQAFTGRVQQRMERTLGAITPTTRRRHPRASVLSDPLVVRMPSHKVHGLTSGWATKILAP